MWLMVGIREERPIGTRRWMHGEMAIQWEMYRHWEIIWNVRWKWREKSIDDVAWLDIVSIHFNEVTLFALAVDNHIANLKGLRNSECSSTECFESAVDSFVGCIVNHRTFWNYRHILLNETVNTHTDKNFRIGVHVKIIRSDCFSEWGTVNANWISSQCPVFSSREKRHKICYWNIDHLVFLEHKNILPLELLKSIKQSYF